MSERVDSVEATKAEQLPEVPQQGKKHEGHAIVCSNMKTGSSNTFDKAELREYEKYLGECGFDVSTNESENLEDIKKALSEVARKSGNSRKLVAVVVLESNKEEDLDDIVRSLQDGNDEADKLVVFCRIAEEDSETRATCLKWDSVDDCRIHLRNIFIISCVVKTRKLATNFVRMITAMKRGFNWHSDRFSEFVEFKGFSPDNYSVYNMKIKHGLAPNLLKESDWAKGIVKDGSRLNSLNREFPNSLGPILDSIDINGVVYRNSGKGKALIIGNESFSELSALEACEADCHNLKYTLELLNYEVIVRQDLTAAEIRKEVNTFANRGDHGDSCILVIMSHGCLDVICGTDYRASGKDEGTVKESELLDLMYKGSGVKQKPRLVLFQACRDRVGRTRQGETNDPIPGGTGPEQVASLLYYGHPITTTAPPPDQCGMIVGHSASEGEKSFNKINGSRFILALCITYLKYARTMDVVSMITVVNYIMTHGFEIPRIVTKDASGNIVGDETFPQQLPCWSVQTDKLFFLVDTPVPFDGPASQQASGQAQPKPDDIGQAHGQPEDS